MKCDRHVVLACDGEGISDELTRFLVGHVETEGPHRETQLVPGVSHRSDRPGHVADEALHLGLAERETAGRRRRPRVSGEAGHELKGQVFRFGGDLRLRLRRRDVATARCTDGEEQDRGGESNHGMSFLEMGIGIVRPEPNSARNKTNRFGLFVSSPRQCTRYPPRGVRVSSFQLGLTRSGDGKNLKLGLTRAGVGESLRRRRARFRITSELG